MDRFEYLTVKMLSMKKKKTPELKRPTHSLFSVSNFPRVMSFIIQEAQALINKIISSLQWKNG